MHQLTSRGDNELLVLLEDWGGRGARAHYDGFSLEPESDHYRLRLGQYHGDAGDSLSWHNDKPFSTVDRDRDSYSGKELLLGCGGMEGRGGRGVREMVLLVKEWEGWVIFLSGKGMQESRGQDSCSGERQGKRVGTMGAVYES